MIGKAFSSAKRRVAMFCVGLCIALATQMTIVVLDRMKHAFQIDHAPNGLAGAVFDHGHHLKVDVQRPLLAKHSHDHGAAGAHVHHTHDVKHSSAHLHAHESSPPAGFHTHDWLPEGHDHGPITHHHHGGGTLSSWLVSTEIELVMLALQVPVLDYGVRGHPDAPAWRRERPPKTALERSV